MRFFFTEDSPIKRVYLSWLKLFKKEQPCQHQLEEIFYIKYCIKCDKYFYDP